MSDHETTLDQSTAVDQPRISYEAVALVLIFIASILLHLTRLGAQVHSPVPAVVRRICIVMTRSITGHRSTFSPSLRISCLVMANGNHACPKR